jgi:hypothetical protein
LKYNYLLKAFFYFTPKIPKNPFGDLLHNLKLKFMNQITLFPYDESALKTLIYDVVRTALSNHGVPISKPTTPEPFIKGIHQLAKFLQVSPVRAQKLKNEGAFPYWQDGRTLLFDPDKVRAAMSKNIKS